MSINHIHWELCKLAARLEDITRNGVDAHIALATNTKNELLPNSILECIKSDEQNKTEDMNKLIDVLTKMTTVLKDDNMSAMLCLQFFSNLILKAAHSNIPKILLLRGYSRMLKRTVECMHSDSSPISLQFRWSDPANVLAIIRSRLTSHPVTHWQVNPRMPDMIMSLFIATMQDRPLEEEGQHASGPDSPAIVYHTVVGPIQKSTMLTATLLMDIPLTREMHRVLNRKRDRGLVVALFECSLELPGGSDKQTIELSMQSVNNESQASTEHIMLHEFAHMLARSHVQVVCCQKRVHPYLVRQLKEHNILCISRVSVKYMGALVRLSGARQLTTMPIIGSPNTHSYLLDPSSLGYLHKVEVVQMHGKPFLVAEGFNPTDTSLSVETTSAEPTHDARHLQDYLLNQFSHLPDSFTPVYAVCVAQRQRNCVTVVVAAPTELTTTLWQRAIEDVLAYLRRLSRERAVVLPGGGIWLALLARELRAYHVLPKLVPPMNRIARQTLAAEQFFVDCIEECAVTSGGAHTQRRQRCSDGEGWDQQQLLAQFALCDKNVATASTLRIVLRSPDGDEVAVVREPRGSTEGSQTTANWTYRLDTSGTNATPPLDSLSGCMSALQIATDAACALLDVDGICTVAATAV